MGYVSHGSVFSNSLILSTVTPDTLHSCNTLLYVWYFIIFPPKGEKEKMKIEKKWLAIKRIDKMKEIPGLGRFYSTVSEKYCKIEAEIIFLNEIDEIQEEASDEKYLENLNKMKERLNQVLESKGFKPIGLDPFLIPKILYLVKDKGIFRKDIQDDYGILLEKVEREEGNVARMLIKSPFRAVIRSQG